MNPTLSQRIVDKAYQEDLQAAKSEYGGEFRDDVAAFIPSDLLQPLVVSPEQIKSGSGNQPALDALGKRPVACGSLRPKSTCH